ncbi:MAG: hypothetical protein QOF03_376 [Alphaproteobacteria bacterium]|nr:hypothetical protein [Alphaproteobacteria bacterium]
MSGGPTISELEERIAMVRQNIDDLIEQAAARSGGADEELASARIAEQEKELARLIALRSSLRTPRASK